MAPGTTICPLPRPSGEGCGLAQEFQQLRNFNYDETVTLEIFGHSMWLKASLEFARQLAVGRENSAF